MTVGTRPANQGGNLLDLDTLKEGEEEEEEEEGEDEEDDEEETTYDSRNPASIRSEWCGHVQDRH